MNNFSLLLPREKYTEESQKYKEVFSTYEIKNPNQVLFYFGANHSRDINNPQYPALREYWNKFLKVTEGKERIVLIEGGERGLAENEREAIKEGSEASLMTLLAHKEKVYVVSPDINDVELARRAPELNREEMLLYWFLSWVNNFQTFPDPKPNFNEYADKWLENEKQRELWRGIETSLSSMKELYKKSLGKDFHENESQNYLINPNRTETIINKIARRFSNLRDENIVSEIAHYWKENKNLFAVFGVGHLIIEKPALEILLVGTLSK